MSYYSSDRVNMRRRMAAGMSQQDLADFLGVSLATVRKWERDPDAPLPPQHMIDRLESAAKIRRHNV